MAAGRVPQRILKKAWFRTISYPGFLKVPGAAGAVWHGNADTAYTDQQKNDPSALLISAYLGQTLYVSFVDEMQEITASLAALLKIASGIGE